MSYLTVECSDCGLVHKESERIKIRDERYPKIEVYNTECPKCGCGSFYFEEDATDE